MTALSRLGYWTLLVMVPGLVASYKIPDNNSRIAGNSDDRSGKYNAP